MDADHVVLGSGLSALGTLLGLRGKGTTIVVAGQPHRQISYYDARATVPCAELGAGGLGNNWHGVIPVSLSQPDLGVSEQSFCALLESFYPGADVRAFCGGNWLFVPWAPIRPWPRIRRLAAESPDSLRIVPGLASRIEIGDQGVTVQSTAGPIRARRVWVAAGALHTPKLLADSFGARVLRQAVSDHMLFYVGQVSGIDPPRVVHTRDGIYFQSWRPSGGHALYTLRPARFRFRQLDFGIEQRAVFGMPTGSAISKIVRRLSPGLLSEAFYNRFGLFRTAAVYSIYAQVRSPQAYRWSAGDSPVEVEAAAVAEAADTAAKLQPFGAITRSRRMDIYIPGIHLHNSVDRTAWRQLGLDAENSAVQVVDPSLVEDIGPEHHSFKVLAAACLRAQRVAS